MFTGIRGSFYPGPKPGSKTRRLFTSPYAPYSCMTHFFPHFLIFIYFFHPLFYFSTFHSFFGGDGSFSQFNFNLLLFLGRSFLWPTFFLGGGVLFPLARCMMIIPICSCDLNKFFYYIVEMLFEVKGCEKYWIQRLKASA